MTIVIPADRAHLIADTMAEWQLEEHVDKMAREHGITPLKIPGHIMKQMPPDWKGWPDRLLIGQHGSLWAELKSEFGRATRDQLAFGQRLQDAGGTWFLWRPSDLIDGTIERELGRIA